MNDRPKDVSGNSRRIRSQTRPGCENLESRVMLDGSNPFQDVPITFGIAPDHASWMYGSTTLNSTLNQQLGQDWPKLIARALQTWASVTDIDFTQESITPSTGFQGSTKPLPSLRFSGMDLGNDSVFSRSIGVMNATMGLRPEGDVILNTHASWSDPALTKVLTREIGFLLGLRNQVTSSSPTDLAPSDVSALQAIFGARTPDAFNQQGQGVSAATAVDLTARGLTTVNGLELSRIGETDYFRVTAPNNGGNVLEVEAVSRGLSLLSPKILVRDAQGRVVGSAASPEDYGNSVRARIQGVTPGATYTIEVTGATGDVFDVGNYQLITNFGNGSGLPVSPPATATPPVVTPPAPMPIPTPTPTPMPPVVTQPPVVTPAPAPAPVPTPAPAPAPAPAPVVETPAPVTDPGVTPETYIRWSVLMPEQLKLWMNFETAYAIGTPPQSQDFTPLENIPGQPTIDWFAPTNGTGANNTTDNNTNTDPAPVSGPVSWDPSWSLLNSRRRLGVWSKILNQHAG